MYDDAGNITAKYSFPGCGAPAWHWLGTYPTIGEKLTTYMYSTSAWGDRLSGYNGKTVAYDAYGNTWKWRNAVDMQWNGRQLTYIYIDGLDEGLGFGYNADGIRTEKTYWDANGTPTYHTYVLDGAKIVKETVTRTNGTDVLYYYYDESGNVIGFEYNGTPYYYQKNIQGDVIGIVNSSCNVVTEYTYDAWGKVLSVTGSLSSTVGKINPFRYRSYYYDAETGFYYLQSSYYVPEIGRFINADGYDAAVTFIGKLARESLEKPEFLMTNEKRIV